MKILHVIDHLGIGGAQKLVCDLAQLQLAKGLSVSVLSLCKTDSFLEVELHKKGIKVDCVYKSIRSIYNPLTILKIHKYLNEADIVHVHLFPANYWCAFYKFFLNKKLKLITTEHNTNNRRRNKSCFKYVDRFIYGVYDAVVACSQKAQQTLEGYLNNSDKNKVLFISNGVPIASFQQAVGYDKAELYGVKDGVKVVTMVARVQEPKDQSTVIRCLKYLDEDIHASFVGDGVLREDCEFLAKKLGVAARCHFLGFRKDVSRIVKTSDINVLSSKWEGLSLSSVECMATGKPFIGTNVQGIKEIVTGAGLLFECGDEKGLATIIKRLLESKELYQSVSYSCYSRAKEYDILYTHNAYMNLYFEILNETIHE